MAEEENIHTLIKFMGTNQGFITLTILVSIMVATNILRIAFGGSENSSIPKILVTSLGSFLFAGIGTFMVYAISVEVLNLKQLTMSGVVAFSMAFFTLIGNNIFHYVWRKRELIAETAVRRGLGGRKGDDDVKR